MDAYSMPYEVRWTDIDANRHVRYSAYIDAAAELRYRFFTHYDLPPEAFDKLGVGPVYTALNATFFREELERTGLKFICIENRKTNLYSDSNRPASSFSSLD